MPKNGFNLVRGTRIVLTSIALLFLFTACVPPREKGVQLLLGTENLQPTSTFELRFDVPVVGLAQVGLPATNSPVVFQPPLPGRFVWLSQRSGVFTPAEPLRLGTTYRLRLAPGLTKENGGRLDASLHRTVQTPSFSVTAVRAASNLDITNAPAEPSLQLEFNADILAQQAAGYIEFRNGQLRVPAQVRQAEEQEYFSSQLELANSGVADGWIPPVRLLPLPAHEATNQNAIRLVANRLVVTPAKPLTPGGEWSLRIATGLPATTSGLKLATGSEITIGTVQPFTVSAIEAHNQIGTGTRLSIQFSKPVSPEIALSNAAAKWFAVRPEPANLSYDVTWNEVTIRGNFRVGSNYTVEVRQGLPAREAFGLSAPFATNRVVFRPVPPRVYFPAFEADQLGWGNREFPVLSVNVPRMRIQAKKLDRNNLVHVLRGYRGYFRRHSQDYDEDEPFRGLDYNLVAGKSIFDRSVNVSSVPDVAEKTHLNWDDILGVGKFGPVFLEAQRAGQNSPRDKSRLGAQAIVQVTDLGLVWKNSGDKIFVHVFSLHTGAACGKVSVRLLTDENDLVSEGLTDDTGSAQLRSSPKAAWLMADSDTDLHAVSLRDYGLPLYAFHIPIEYSSERAREQALVFSDREVYRPGETLFLKAICREWQDDALSLPTNGKAALQCFDSKGQKFYETNLTLTSFGSLAHGIALPSGPLGSYRIELALGGRSYHHSFSVLQYHPSTFEVTCPVKPAYPAGEKPALAVSGKYFMGKPLSKAQVHWVLNANDRPFSPEGFDDFTFCTDGGLRDVERSASSLSLQGEADSLTNLVLTPDLTFNPQAPQPRSVHLEIVVTDLDQQTVSHTSEFLCHSSDYYFGLTRPKEVLAAGQKLALDFAAIRSDGQPVTETLMATVRVSRVEWQSVRIQGAGRSAVYRNEAISTNLFERQLPSRKVTRIGEKWAWAQAAGPAAEFALPQAGFYVVEVEGADSAGRPVLSAYGVYVYGKESLGWNYRNPAQIELIPQEKSYKPGQTATLLVKTPISGHALVTVERERVLRSFVTKLQGNAPVVKVPLLESDAPNVFVSVMLLRGSAQSARQFKQPEYRLGYCQLKVEKPETQLNVQVRPGTNDYLPGEYVQVETLVRNPSGQPVPEAEVTLYAVDEGVLTLTDYQKPDPLTHFYQPRGLAVRTSLSLPNLLPEDPDQLRFANKGYLVGGGGLMHRLRKNFVTCAFWDANLRTDKEGMVKVSFQAPDNLTRYRLIAVAQTARHQFGSAESAFQVNKPVMLEPVLPRFANIGDQLTARALLLSRHPVAGEVELTLKLDGKASTTNLLKERIPLPPNGSAVVEIPLEFAEAGKSTWNWTARFFEKPGQAEGSPQFFSDSVQTSIDVGYPVPLLHEIHLARTDAAASNLLAGVNPQLLEGSGEVTVRVSNTRLSELAEAVSQLLHYPYGCVEQTGSSLLPWIVLQDLQPALQELKHSPADIQSAIQSGVQRLLSMQTSSGGLSYWPGSREPLFWGSAYGGMVLALAARNGYHLPSSAWNQLADYLASELRQARNMDAPEQLSSRCLALFALALGGRAEASLHEVLYGKRHLLDAQNRALLALAIAESKGPNSMIHELLQGAPGAPGSAQDWFDCGARDAAVRLLAWLRLEPGSPKVDVLVAELMKSQKKGHWFTTQGNAWALFALTDYARRVEGRLAPASGAIRWGAEQAEFSLEARPTSFGKNFDIRPGLASAPLSVQSKQRLFTQVTLEARPRTFKLPRQDRGYAIRRSYTRLDDSNQPLAMEGLRVGDRVLITLELDVRLPAHFLAIEDPLPAILEAVYPEFKTQGTAADQQFAQDWVSDFRELRADRALFFRNHLAPGSYKICYLARVRSAGLAMAPAAKVEEMYHPERFGLTETTRLSSRALE